MSDGLLKNRINEAYDGYEFGVDNEEMCSWVDEAKSDLLKTSTEPEDTICVSRRKFKRWFGDTK